MKKHDNRYESDWIITTISSGAEGAAVYKLHGNIDDLKQTILSFANSDRERDEDSYEYGCEIIDDIADSSNGCGWLFSAYNIFSQYHIDYQAIDIFSTFSFNSDNCCLIFGQQEDEAIYLHRLSFFLNET